jgi:GNAT superfamily N-acetyltransferase
MKKCKLVEAPTLANENIKTNTEANRMQNRACFLLSNNKVNDENTCSNVSINNLYKFSDYLNLKSMSDLKLVRLTSYAEKKKWQMRFVKNYSGTLTGLTDEVFNDKVSLFFVAKSGDKELGFIRITNYTDMYSDYTNELAWSASDAYVKPCYQKQGVLRFMLDECVRNHNVVSALIKTERFEKNIHYYKSLGFTFKVRQTISSDLSYIFQSSFENVILKMRDTLIASNDAQYNIAA